MASVTVGPPWPANGPIPVAPPYSLLNLPGVLVPDPGDEHWAVGIEEWPYPRDLPDAIDACSEGTFRNKPDGEGWNLSTFGPFTLSLPITCSAIVAKRDGFAERASIALRARESYGVSHELAWGTAQPLNPHLTDGNTHILASGAAVRPDVGLAYLEDAIGVTGSTGIIHASPAVATAWNGDHGYGVNDIGGNLYTTANRTPVAVSGAYIGARPDDGAAPSGTRSWAFASSPVLAYRWPEVYLIAPTLKESLDREINEVTYRAERNYVVIYDAPESDTDFRPVQAAVLIDWAAA